MLLFGTSFLLAVFSGMASSQHLFPTSNETVYDLCKRDKDKSYQFCLQQHLVSKYIARGYPRSLHSLPQTQDSAKHPFYMFVDVMPVRIQQVDIEDQSVKLRVDIDIIWHDPFLNWRKDGAGEDIEFVLMSAFEIWTPDISSVKSGEVVSIIGTSHRHALVFPRGFVLFTLSLEYRSPCQFNVLKYPFDEHKCTVEFATWAYPSDKVILLPAHKFKDHYNGMCSSSEEGEPETDEISCLTDDESLLVRPRYDSDMMTRTLTEQHPNWDVLNWSFASNSIEEGPRWKISKISYNINIKRQNDVYATTLILPTIMLSILSLGIFLLPVADSFRMDFGLNIMLSYFVLLTIIIDGMPASDTIPIMGRYAFFSILSISFSIVISAILNKLYQFKLRKKKLPQRLENLVLRLFSDRCQNQDCEIVSEKPLKIRHGTEENLETIGMVDWEMITADPSKTRHYSQTEVAWDLLIIILNRTCFVIFAVANIIVMISTLCQGLAV